MTHGHNRNYTTLTDATWRNVRTATATDKFKPQFTLGCSIACRQF